LASGLLENIMLGEFFRAFFSARKAFQPSPALLTDQGTPPDCVDTATDGAGINSSSINPTPTTVSYIEKVRSYHEDNFLQITTALEHTEKSLRKFIAKGDEPNEVTFTRLYTMLLGVWCEARLHKLLYEKGAFDEVERGIIYNTKSLDQRWKCALEIGLKKNANVKLTDEITIANVGFTKFKIHKEIQDWITEHLAQAITLRNKIAHAQWEWPFGNMQDTWIDSNNFKICGNSISILKKENLLTTSFKVELAKEIATTINNLAVDSKVYKSENFDDRYTVVSSIVDRLNSADYKAFKKKVSGTYAH
jgi:hypothetical protein